MSTKKVQIVGGINANTLGGKTVDEFATTSDVADLRDLVGDTSVSEQINTAVAEKSQVQIITWEADD